MLFSSSDLLYYLCFCITHLSFSHSFIIKHLITLWFKVNSLFPRNYKITYQMRLDWFNWLKNNCSNASTSLPMFCKPRTQTIKGEFHTCLQQSPTHQRISADSNQCRTAEKMKTQNSEGGLPSTWGGERFNFLPSSSLTRIPAGRHLGNHLLQCCHFADGKLRFRKVLGLARDHMASKW